MGIVFDQTTESIEYASVRGEFEDALRSGYIDSSIPATSQYAPRLITNNREQATDLLSVIQQELRDCESFCFTVAFITEGGLQVLLETLRDLKERGVPGKLLTTTYNNFNKPDVFNKLLDFQNIETRVYQGNFHTKGYLFNKGITSTVIIGSSNLTQKALRVNKEWNILYHSFESGRMLQEATTEFDALWNDEATTPLSEDWIETYRNYLASSEPIASTPPKPTFSANKRKASTPKTSRQPIEPNQMQQGALEQLAIIHEKHEPRALLISATGTGKTYLAALDVRQAKPERVLFVVHRERILEAAMESFENVLGDNYTYELYGAGCAKPESSCVFAMVRTLQLHLHEFDPDEFDYIIVDEAHHVGATGYQMILDHFKPSFVLGMTATPNRTDSYDVFSLFNHCIAYRITLQDALESDLLVPFHYFGIADLEIDDTVVNNNLFNRLISDVRVDHIIKKIEEYSIRSRERRGLIFCSRKEEARELSSLFNARGYRTVALTGSNNDSERNRAISRLESGEIEYIFTVDIFNEGVDIPSLNQIIMLRRTESAIVFVQQLGRGLRKHDSKEFTLVLDFIGNYQTNFLVPIALSGDRTYNKDNLRRFIKEPIVPGCSTINFDRISEKRVMKSIDDGKFSEARLIRQEYENLKQELGRIPSILDFDANQAIDPLLIIQKYGSYYAFISKVDRDYQHVLPQTHCDLLKFVSLKLANGKRFEELLLLHRLLSGKHETERSFRVAAEQFSGRFMSNRAIHSVEEVLSGRFSSVENLPLVSRIDGGFELSSLLSKCLEDAEFAHQLFETIEFGLNRHRALYAKTYQDTNLVLYAKYTYEEVCRLLNWDKNINGQNIGGYKYDATTNTYPVFINYEKDPEISDSIRYEDRFLSDSSLIAISKQPRNMSSPEIRRLQAWPQNGMQTFLFVRKNKNDGDGGKEFYFLGTMHPTQQYREFVMPGTTKNAVEIWYELDVPVRADIYDYITRPLD